MAEKALKLHNFHIKGSAIQVFISKPPSEGEKDEQTLFVNNLPFTCTEAMLRDHFTSALADPTLIEEVRLIRDPKSH
jgi:RNA recognition motif-containing protein